MVPSLSSDRQPRSSTSSTPPHTLHTNSLCDSSDSEPDVDPFALGYAPLGTGPAELADQVDTTIPLSHSDTPDNPSTRILQMGTRQIPLPTGFPEKTLSEADADTIRSVMSRFSPPSYAIPEWAKHIPEEVWLPTLVTLPRPIPSSTTGDPNNHDVTFSNDHNPTTQDDDD
ncbi:hypothetical protein IWQ61_009045 [Dispira simplex]|nr:hypothetical protein IWQ61_009045 [Dispira simplex]